jgi:hypothetical protein
VIQRNSLYHAFPILIYAGLEAIYFKPGWLGKKIYGNRGTSWEDSGFEEEIELYAILPGIKVVKELVISS